MVVYAFVFKYDAHNHILMYSMYDNESFYFDVNFVLELCNRENKIQVNLIQHYDKINIIKRNDNNLKKHFSF